MKTRKTLKQIFEAKKAERGRSALLPIEKKIEILIQMQERMAPILAARGIHLLPWRTKSRLVQMADTCGNGIDVGCKGMPSWPVSTSIPSINIQSEEV